MLCYWACACAYIVFLFIPIYVSRLDDFQIKARAQLWCPLAPCIAVIQKRRVHHFIWQELCQRVMQPVPCQRG